MDNIIKLAQELITEIEATKQQRKLDGQEKRTLDRLKYLLKSKGVGANETNTKEKPQSKLAAKYSQQKRNSQLFKGGLQASKIAKEESKQDKQALEERLAAEVEEHEATLLEDAGEQIVLATSEEKPKRGRKPRKK